MVRTTRGTATVPARQFPSHFLYDTGDMDNAFGMICLRTSAAGRNVRSAAHDTPADIVMVVRRRSSRARRYACSASSCAVCLAAFRERECRIDLEVGYSGGKNARESGEKGERGETVSKSAAGAVFWWRAGATVQNQRRSCQLRENHTVIVLAHYAQSVTSTI